MSASADAYVLHHDTPFGAVLALVADELSRACGKFEAFNSGHEGKAVIEEELDELWAEIKANAGSSDAAMLEAIQVAAMSLRYVLDLGDPLRLLASAQAPLAPPKSEAWRNSADFQGSEPKLGGAAPGGGDR